MITEITSEKFKNNLDTEVRRCIDNHKALKVKRADGEAFIVIGETDWKSIEETLYLNRIPGMAESILKAAEEPLSLGTDLEELDW